MIYSFTLSDLRMEVLFVTHKFPPFIGGMERQSFELISYFKSKFEGVHIIAYEGQMSKARFFLTVMNQIKKLLQKHPGIGVIHLNDGLLALRCQSLRKWKKAKLVVTLHGLDICFPSRWFVRQIKNQWHIFDQFICVSRATRDMAISKGIPAEKISVVRNGVQVDVSKSFKGAVNKFEFDPKKSYLVTTGRGVRRKGFAWFVEFVLPNLGPDVHLLHITPQSKYGSFSRFFSSILPNGFQSRLELILGLASDDHDLILLSQKYSNYFRLHGLSDADKQFVFANSDLFIVPNIRVQGDMEGFGLVALEAAILGKKVLAADLEGLRDAIIHQKNGVRITSGNVNQWTQTILSCLHNRDLLSAEGEAARQYTIQHYSWEKMGAGYAQIFERLGIRLIEKPRTETLTMDLL